MDPRLKRIPPFKPPTDPNTRIAGLIVAVRDLTMAVRTLAMVTVLMWAVVIVVLLLRR